jgi:hypothetical protein
MAERYADAVFSERGQCWRFVDRAPDDGRPKLCPNPVTRVGTTRMAKGRRIRVWSCEAHADDATFQPAEPV